MTANFGLLVSVALSVDCEKFDQISAELISKNVILDWYLSDPHDVSPASVDLQVRPGPEPSVVEWYPNESILVAYVLTTRESE